LQAGQMLTILGFLFFQSVAFGFAACALIPLQAWLIPKLQRQINLLNKKRVIQVRALAAEIGEAAAGAGTLRKHGGWRYRMAMVGDRLGRLYAIRFEIYQKKFFMKFLNNFITQLTPFFFFSIGGYLVIRGDVTLGPWWRLWRRTRICPARGKSCWPITTKAPTCPCAGKSSSKNSRPAA
ncbi:MAG: hypothetical protein AAFY39_04500, partial [Pseudomonadota bacterium]